MSIDEQIQAIEKKAYQYMVRIGCVDACIETDVPIEKWGFNTRATVRSLLGIRKHRDRFNKWYRFFNNRNPEMQKAAALFYGTPIPDSIRRVFELPDKSKPNGLPRHD